MSSATFLLGGSTCDLHILVALCDLFVCGVSGVDEAVVSVGIVGGAVGGGGDRVDAVS